MTKSKSVTQEFVALVQLAESVQHFHCKNYISAITLAGAAEEIFGKMSEEAGASNTFGTETFLFESFGISDYPKYRNRIRNSLKHMTENKKVTYHNLKISAAQLISAAIVNYKLTYKKLPKNNTIIQFCREVGLS